MTYSPLPCTQLIAEGIGAVHVETGAGAAAGWKVGLFYPHTYSPPSFEASMSNDGLQACNALLLVKDPLST